MPTFGRPGVYTTEQLTALPSPATPTGPSTAGFIGEHFRGPVNTAILCNGWADFVRYFGGFNASTTPVLANTYLPFAVYEFFANGGTSAYVARVASSSSPGATASVTLVDSSATPQNTLELTAGRLGMIGNPGTWGNSLYVTVANRGGAGSGRFDLTIYSGGTTSANAVEAWADLSMNATDSRYVLSILNAPTSGSLWVVATNLNDSAAPPNNAPASVTTSQFSGGTDPGDPSVADRQAAVTVGTSPFDLVEGILNINLPGESTASVLQSAIVYANTRKYTFLVLDPPSGQTPAQVVTYLGSLAPPSSYAALYYPWVVAVDPSASSLTSTRLLPPGGFVLGEIAETDTTVGVWKAPAGINAQLGVVQAERTFSPGDLDTLNLANVNVLKTRASGAVNIFGTRTMQSSYSTLYVPVRRTLNFLEYSLTQLIDFAVFAPNGPLLWGTVSSVCSQFLSGIWSQGGLSGQTASQAYYVTCDSSNNTPQSIGQGVLNVAIGVALLYPAEFISILLTQLQSSGTTTTTVQF